jgi:hypothetical protein
MIKRIKPIQDTFIVRTQSSASFGGDEILELGTCYRPDAEGCSRILLEFMTNEVEELLGNHSLVRATLNLKYAYSENLPSVYGIDVTEIEQEWTEGEGHVNDLPANTSGANWVEARPGHPWEVEGGEDGPEPEPSGSIVSCSCGCGQVVIPDDPFWQDILDNDMVKHEYFTSYQKNKDICFDVTEWVYNWILGNGKGLGFLIKLSNEQIMVDRKARLCFYSSETHTVNYPYLEIVYDDSCRKEGVEEYKEEELHKIIVKTRNLREHYYPGEMARVDLIARPEFPVRTFTTSSIYRDGEKALPDGCLWGIRDEYTGEMWVPFTDFGTKISYDTCNYFILNTNLLEPERYYRLLFEIETEGSRKVVDDRTLFRVTRYGES